MQHGVVVDERTRGRFLDERQAAVVDELSVDYLLYLLVVDAHGDSSRTIGSTCSSEIPPVWPSTRTTGAP
ncbi:hypothetical protein GCM10009549_28510 [Streptomyces thermoalcalitolerans]|uniref:Uncharacterized protein n=1 Tax=Streptomyces thermoalcalitolerans TaxID=65605 RepID=A0ABP3Z527_9ACTN